MIIGIYLMVQLDLLAVGMVIQYKQKKLLVCQTNLSNKLQDALGGEKE